MFIKIFTITAGAVLLVIYAVEFRVWAKKLRAVTRRQKFYRTFAFIIMEGIFAMIFFHQTPAPAEELYDIGYWGIALGLACLLVIIALADVREELNSARISRREALKNLLDGKERRQQ